MLALARDEAFRTLLEPHRRAITLHCYRMLGSLHDAEDVAQESLTRAWQRLGQLKSGSATQAWLYKIATNACLDLVKSRRRRVLPWLHGAAASPETPQGPPAHERFWMEPAPDALLEVPDDPKRGPDAQASMRESISLAFITALQFLSPRQRAALLLVDVLRWGPREVADLLETSVVSVSSLLQRARKNMEARPPEEISPPEPSENGELLRRYIQAWESGDLDAFIALLAEDARLSMPPQPEWYEGRESIRRFLAGVLAAEPRRYRLLPLRANGERAVAVYRRPITSSSAYEPAAITVLSFRAGRVSEMIRFTSPTLFPLFGLPPRA